MTASLIVAAVGAVAAAIGTGLLTARSARTPRIFLIAWTVAVFALAVALGAQTLGGESGYTALIFRCMEIGAQALAPLALCLSLVELISRSVTGRFLMRLAASALGIILLAILGTDPLGTTTPLSKSWPDPTAFYQLIPLGLIKFVAAFTILTAVVSGIVALARSGRGRGFAAVVGPALATAAAATMVAVPGLMMIAHVRQHASVFALTGLLAAALTWLAATTAGRRGLTEGRMEDDRDGARQYADSDWYEPDDERDYPRGRADDFDRRDDYLSPPYLDERRGIRTRTRGTWTSARGTRMKTRGIQTGASGTRMTARATRMRTRGIRTRARGIQLKTRHTRVRSCTGTAVRSRRGSGAAMPTMTFGIRRSPRSRPKGLTPTRAFAIRRHVPGSNPKVTGASLMAGINFSARSPSTP